MTRQPLLRRRHRHLLRGPVQGRADRHRQPGQAARKPPSSASVDRPEPAAGRTGRRLALPGHPLRKPLRHPDRPLHRRQGPRTRRHGQAGRQGRPRTRHRPDHHHLRQPAADPLLLLQAALPRRSRAPLATPPACGEYKTDGHADPVLGRSDAEASPATATFQIEQGPEGGACPAGGLPPFHPGLIAGTHQQRRRALLPLQRQALQDRRRTGDHPLLDQAAPRE